MKKTLHLFTPILALASLAGLSSCSTSPADAAVNAATAGMGPVKSAAVREATGHGTGPVEKAKNEVSDKVDDIRD